MAHRPDRPYDDLDPRTRERKDLAGGPFRPGGVGCTAGPGSRPRRGTTPKSGAGGFILPAALLALTLLALLATGGWIVSHIEYRVSESHRASLEAFYTADGALEHRLAGSAWPAGAGGPGLAEPGTAVVGVPPHEAVLRWEPLLRLDDAGTVVRARASSGVSAGPGGRARRTVEAAVVLPGAIRPVAALGALSGLEDAEGALLSGFDAAPEGACDGAPGAPVAGVALTADPAAGHALPDGAEGSPPVLIPAAWQAFRTAAYVASHGSGGSGSEGEILPVAPESWLAADTLAADRWPALRVEGGSTVLGPQHRGRGTILATGDLVLRAGFRWDGLLLVGGGLRIEGDVRIRGAVAAGLARFTGGSAGPVVLEGPGIEIRYHSCHAAAAAGALPALPALVRGSWREAI